MRIIVVGTGYVGLVTGVCLAENGNKVTCVDIDKVKIERLNQGIIPIYENGLEEMVKRNIDNGNLTFTTSLSSVIDSAEVVFSAVGTPPLEDGSADLKYVLEVAKEFGNLIKRYTVFVTKSTVPVGTADKVEDVIKKSLEERGMNLPFDVVANPEFLKEGDAIKDFLNPERIVIGTKSDFSKDVMRKLYEPFVDDNEKLIFTDIHSAEMIKYAANSMLATRISFMNEIANLCEKVGANVECVKKGIGMDDRIGSKFLNAGCGYGGSCFPKDVKALIQTGVENGENMTLLKAVNTVNDLQKKILFQKLSKNIGNVEGKTICILGLSFKPGTDDMREAPSVVLIKQILSNGGKVRAYDPIAIDSCRSIFKDEITYCKNPYDAADKSDAIVLITEWKEFKSIKWEIIKEKVQNKVIIDGRNLYDRKELESFGFLYDGFGN